MIKKVLSLVLSLLMVAGSVNLTFAVEDTTDYSGHCGENMTYVFDPATKILTISGSGTVDGSFDFENENITQEVEEVKFENFSGTNFPCLAGFTKISKINIPESVNKLLSWHFEGCSQLKEVILPKDLEDLSSNCFENCTSLTNIDLPENLYRIPFGCFFNCEKLENIEIPKNIEIINDVAFDGCKSLKSIVIPKKTWALGQGAFANCTNLEKVTMTDNTDTIFDSTFENCGKLTIYGVKGSYAEEYAKKVGIPFKECEHVWNTEYTLDYDATTNYNGQKSIHCSLCNAINKDSIIVIPKPVVPITSVKLNKTSVTVKKGKTYTLTATFNPSNATNKKLTWTSSNSKVVKVNSKGVVTAINYGKATITAKTNNGKTAKCTVTVPYTITYKLNGGKNNKSNPSSYYGKKITLKNPTKKGYTFSGWYSDSKFKKKITNFSSGNKTLYAKWTKVKVSKAKTPKLTNVKGKKLKITYSATSGAKGYQIQYSTSKKFTKATTKTVKGKSATYTLAKKTYYVRVRAYKTDSTGAKVYGSWSTVKSIKIKK